MADLIECVVDHEALVRVVVPVVDVRPPAEDPVVCRGGDAHPGQEVVLAEVAAVPERYPALPDDVLFGFR